jgi:hypothetical protein
MAIAILRRLKLNLAKFSEPPILLHILKAANGNACNQLRSYSTKYKSKAMQPVAEQRGGVDEHAPNASTQKRDRAKIKLLARRWGHGYVCLGCKVLSELLVISSYGAHSIDQTGQF